MLKIIQSTVKQKAADQSGFTLIEILVAISILAIIGAISIPNLRHFNETQILQNTTNDLVRILREAQSSANSHIQCTSVLIAKEWVVDLSASSYTLKSNCYNPTATTLPVAIQTDTRYIPAANSISGVGWSLRTSPSAANCPTALIKFSAEYQPYSQNRFSNISSTCGDPTDDKLEIKLTKTGLDPQFVCIDKGGAIYGSTASCF